MSKCYYAMRWCNNIWHFSYCARKKTWLTSDNYIQLNRKEADKNSIRYFRLIKLEWKKLSTCRKIEREFTIEHAPLRSSFPTKKRRARVSTNLVCNFFRRDNRFPRAILCAPAREQEANWNGRKTCVAVTVQTYRLSTAVLLPFSSLFLLN